MTEETKEKSKKGKQKEEPSIVISKNTLIAVVLGVLVLVSLVQAFQLTGLKGQLSGAATGEVKKTSVSTPTASDSGASSNAELPSSLQNLPTMVGGC